MNVYQHQLIQSYQSLIDPQYALFNASIAKTNYKIMGVRLPQLRQLARSYGQTMDIFDNYDFITYEDVMLYGLMAFCKHRERNDLYHLYDVFNTKIDSWAYSDSAYKNYRWFDHAFLNDHINDLKGNAPFRVRSYLNIILVARKYLNVDIFSILDQVNCHDYYVNMMVAWIYQILMVESMDKTIEHLKKHPCDPTILKMMVSKCHDSYQLTPQQKQQIKMEFGHVSK